MTIFHSKKHTTIDYLQY